MKSTWTIFNNALGKYLKNLPPFDMAYILKLTENFDIFDYVRH